MPCKGTQEGGMRLGGATWCPRLSPDEGLALGCPDALMVAALKTGQRALQGVQPPPLRTEGCWEPS